MKQGLTNVGKKEQRQIDQRLTKEAQVGRSPGDKEAEASTVPKAHRIKGRKKS
jgi:hypothetical protein